MRRIRVTILPLPDIPEVPSPTWGPGDRAAAHRPDNEFPRTLNLGKSRNMMHELLINQTRIQKYPLSPSSKPLTGRPVAKDAGPRLSRPHRIRI